MRCERYTRRRGEMKITTKVDDRVAVVEAKHFARVAIPATAEEARREPAAIDRVEVQEVSGPEGSPAKDMLRVYSRGVFAGELFFDRGLGERVARWMLPYAIVETR